MRYRNDLIKGKMAQLDISAEKLADIIGFNVKTVHKVKRGEDVRFSTLATIARALNMKLSEIVEEAAPEIKQEEAAA